MAEYRYPTREEAERLKAQYPAGTRIMLDLMPKDPNPIAPGTKGTVQSVDDGGMLNCVWDDGRVLGVIPTIDKFHVISD